jgi:hypothetical protein
MHVFPDCSSDDRIVDHLKGCNADLFVCVVVHVSAIVVRNQVRLGHKPSMDGMGKELGLSAA